METYMCLPNLLAGGLAAGALPGLALAADKRAQHTHATRQSTAHARHTKRDVWVCTGDITAAIEMGGGREAAAPPSLSLLSYHTPVHNTHTSLFVWRACVVLFCVACVCCALLSAASARPGSAPAGKPPAKRLGKQRASRIGRQRSSAAKY